MKIKKKRKEGKKKKETIKFLFLLTWIVAKIRQKASLLLQVSLVDGSEWDFIDNFGKRQVWVFVWAFLKTASVFVSRPAV